ncbi:TlpA family protein disulfide reductase [Capnocytophaga canimorsus]|uniref:TlpA family protein disulfide reductase n=1 Tax=Capnocytophaga canimorsus TaxID=28188 RepID=UPI00384CB5E0
MKRFIIPILGCAVLASCTDKAPEYTVLSGKVSNYKQDKIRLFGDGFRKEVVLNADGSFSDTLMLAHNGGYTIGNTNIYLHKGKNLNINVDVKDLDRISVSGDLAPENEYLLKKSKLTQSILGKNVADFYKLEEQDYVNKVKELTEKQKELLKNTTFNIDGFKALEEKAITYEADVLLNRYRDYHAYYTQQKDFKTSENFPKISTTDFDNAEDFRFSRNYRTLVSTQIQNEISQAYKEQFGEDFQDEKYVDITIDKVKKIKSDNIRNSMANDLLSYYIQPSSTVGEKVYNELMTIINDDKIKSELTDNYNKIKALAKGNPSPTFNFENHKGGKTALADLKGKLVYIDVWATWCGPCLQEIPHLKEVEKKYHGKNIEFVSISVDDKRDYDKWKNFVTERELVGTQLFADNAWDNDFVKNYVIKGIPRFILLDTQGNIISADAPRPSDPKLIELLTENGI